VSGAKRSPVSALWHAATRAIHPLAAALQAQTTPRAYLPFVPRSLCPGQVLANGDFEQGAEGRHQYTTGTGYKAHDLIGSDAGGFQPYLGHYGARLGGYEGTWDVLTRTVSIPAGGRLSYWWQMHTYETTIFHDNLQVDLLTIEGEIVAHLAGHGIEGQEGIWQQDVVDVSAHAGRTLVLRFHAYNDNYYFSWFDLDQVCLQPSTAQPAGREPASPLPFTAEPAMPGTPKTEPDSLVISLADADVTCRGEDAANSAGYGVAPAGAAKTVTNRARPTCC